MFNTDELFELLGELRQHGFDFSTEQYIAVHDLLLTLAAQGHWSRVAKRLRTHLAPILCTSPKEQEIFYDRFDNWLASRLELVAPPINVVEPDKESFQPESDLQTLAKRLRPWRWMLAAATVLLLGIAAAIFLQPEPIVWLTLQGRVFAPDQSPLAGAEALFLDQKATTDSAGHFAFRHLPKDSSAHLSVTHPNPSFAPHQRLIALNRSDTSGLLIQLDSLKFATKPEPVSPQPISQVDEIPQSQLEALVERINRFADQVEADQQPKSALARAYRDHFEMIRVSVTALPLLIFGLWWWWQWRLRRLLLEKHSTANTPEMQRLVVKGGSDELFRGPAFRRTAQQLRRHREVVSSELDAPATVGATIDHGGWFTPVYLGRQVLPEYLVLIDRATFHDQQARRVDELVARLREDGVFVDRYYFDGDPRRCRRDDPQAPLLTLEELANRHPEHRLLIFSDGLGFMHPLTNKPQRWLALFSAWHDRAMLTPEFPNQWGYREIALAGLDFVVLPATQAGLTVLVDTIEKNAPPLTQQNRNDAFPEMLHERPRLYLERHEPEPTVIDQLCRELQAYLGHDGYAWFSACAVYPVPTWDLTIYLGYALQDAAGEKLITEERLLKLARLPWLRFGTMPDWLRLRLIDDLPREQERAIRQALEELLKSVLVQPHEGFVLDIARPAPIFKRRDWRRLLQDFLRATPEHSKIYDYVFLGFMSGRKPSKLAVNVPNLLRRVFYRRGQAMFGLQPATAFSLAVGLALCGWKISSYNLIPPMLVMPRFQIVSEDPQLLSGLLIPNLARSDSAWSYYANSLLQRKNSLRADFSRENTFATTQQLLQSYRSWLADTLARAVGFDSTVFELKAEVTVDSTNSAAENLASLRRAPLCLVIKLHTDELTANTQENEQYVRLLAARAEAALRHSALEASQQPSLSASSAPQPMTAREVSAARFDSVNVLGPEVSNTALRLRSTASTLSIEQAKAMLRDKGYFDSDWNDSGKGIKHQYRPLAHQGQQLVLDYTTGLTWQQSGSAQYIKYYDAEQYVRNLNKQRFAGNSDWRLPTLEEAMSLMEPTRSSDSLYIDPVFDNKLWWIWTADKNSVGVMWGVRFYGGGCDAGSLDNYGVRAVRSGVAISAQQDTVILATTQTNDQREINDQPTKAAQSQQSGYAHFASKNYTRAIASYDSALNIFRNVGDRMNEAVVLDNLGQAHFASADYRHAIAYYDSALIIFRRIGARKNESVLLGNLGQVYFALANYRLAIAIYDSALAISQTIGDRQSEGVLLRNLGDAYHSLGSYEQAITFYNKALIISREIGDPKNESDLRANLQEAYFRLGVESDQSSSLSSNLFYSNRYAVVIGINQYANTRWPSLKNARNDAEGVANLMKALGFIVYKLFDSQATRLNIISLLEDNLAPKLQKDDAVLFYFAGHSVTRSLGGRSWGYIAPSDATDKAASLISLDEIETLSLKMETAKHQLFIMDCSFGGILSNFRGIPLDTSNPNYLQEASKRKARKVLSAADANQVASDGGPDGHSLFTGYLIKGIEGKADLNADGWITFSELTYYLLPIARQKKQTPVHGILPGDEQGEFLFQALPRKK